MNKRPNLVKPRWRKVLADLWDDKARTILVVASIASGVFAIGMIVTSFDILSADIGISYSQINPANITISTEPFDDNFINTVERVPGVESVEGRRTFSVRARRAGENWQALTVVVLDDFETSVINQLARLEGSGIAERGEVLVGQDFVKRTGFEVGDVIEIELNNGDTYNLTVAGLVNDQTTAEAAPLSNIQIYILRETLWDLGLADQFDKLYITVAGDGTDEAFIEQVADDIEREVERSRSVFLLETQRSNEHPMTDTVLAVIGVLAALGALITILSSSLIVNTLNALLTQQLRQIGVMKLIGGRSDQIMGMYLTLVFAYSVIALVISIPLGAIGGFGLAQLVSGLLGATVFGFRYVPLAIVLQVVVAFAIPLFTGYWPVNAGAKTNVRRAISNYRPDGQTTGAGNRAGRWFRWLSRPVLLSFRNTFRKKGRLVLTIFSLTVAGAVFIGVFNVRAAMNDLMENVMAHFLSDVTVDFQRPYRLGRVENQLRTIDGVADIEAWEIINGEILDENDEVVTNLVMLGPPKDSELVDLEIVAGRFLEPDDEKAIVVAETIWDFYPDLQPGDTLTLKLSDDREEEWTVVGMFRFLSMLGFPMAYTHFDTLTAELNSPGQSTSFRVVTYDHSEAFQDELAKEIDEHLLERGFAVSRVETGNVLRESSAVAVNTLVVFLLMMAALTAFVGSIGLTGTMSMNVLERTREIGVMRSIGAVDGRIMQSVIIEGLVIGLITWLLAIGAAVPVSRLLLAIVGEAIAGQPIDLYYTPFGVVLWLVIVVFLSIFASIMPARRAARLTINEVLAYE